MAMAIMVNTIAATPIIMAADRPGPIWIGLFGALAIGLAALAAPRAISAYHALEARPILWSLAAGERPSAVDLTQAIAALEAARSAHDSASLASDQGRLRMALLPRDPSVVELEALVTLTEATLRRAPVNPSLWARLAWLRYRLDQPAAAVRAALRLSFLTGPVVPELMITRLGLALAVLDASDREFTGLVHHSIRQSWVLYPAETLALGNRHPEPIGAAMLAITEAFRAAFRRVHQLR
ncbi:MAG: hypothetical protein SF002_17355 [Alphaproteobacteria bacterium]|nr:hypothetical protein [Alphaproteobacteria bacterium]